MSLDEVSSGERWEEMNRFGISIVALTGLVDRLDGVGEERERLQGFCWNNWWPLVLLAVCISPLQANLGWL